MIFDGFPLLVKMSKSVRLSSRFANMEPPDKKRRMENGEASDGMWDDDFDQLLTQDNLNVIDNLITASQSVERPRSQIPAVRGLNNNDGCDFYGELRENSKTRVKIPEKPNSRVSVGVARSSPLPSNLLGFEKKVLASDDVNSFTARNSAQLLGSENTLGTLLNENRKEPLMRKQCQLVPDSTVAGGGTNEVINSGANTGSEAPSPALPNSSAQVMQVDCAHILAECSYYKAEFNKLKEGQFAKDGQIKILRQRCDQAQTDLNKKNLEMVRLLNQKSEEKSKREADLEAENERLKTQLQFRQQEVSEMKIQLKKREKQCIGTTPVSDSSRSPIVGIRCPPKSPVASKSPSVAAARHTDSCNFPSSQSFLAHNVASSSHSAGKLAGHDSNENARMRRQKMKLGLSQPNGFSTGPCLVDGFLQQELTQLFSHSNESPLAYASGKSNMARPCTEMSQKSPSYCNKSPVNGSQKVDETLCFAQLSFNNLLSGGYGSAVGETKPSVLLLPLIEESLKKFTSVLQNQKKSPNSSSSGLLSVMPPIHPNIVDASGLPMGHLGGNGGESAPDVVQALRVLLHLVKHSEHARTVICDAKSVHSNIAQMNQLSDAVVSMSISRIQNDCQLAELLIYLTHPVHTLTKPLWKVVPILCLDILRILLRHCPEDKCSRFLPLFKGECLSLCLKNNSCFALPYHTLSLISTAVRLPSIARGFCSIGDECLLSSVISFCTQETFGANWTSFEVNSIHLKMVSILGGIIRLHFNGSRWLTSSNCECSSKLVKGLLQVICDEYCSYSNDSNSTSLLVIRLGVSALHFVAAENKSFVVELLDFKSDYHPTLANVRKLFRHHPEIPRQEDDFWLTLSDVLPFNCLSDEEDTSGDKTEEGPLESEGI